MQLPLGGERADLPGIVQALADWLAESDLATLFVDGEPSATLVGAQRESCRA